MIDKLLLEDFKFQDRFLGLTPLQLGQALQIVNAQFSGVYTLWSILPPGDRDAKRELCINYLVAWQLTQLYPDAAIDAGGTGGMPLQSKKAGPIFIRYRDSLRQNGALEMLTTNQYGIQALAMIQSAPEMYQVYA